MHENYERMTSILICGMFDVERLEGTSKAGKTDIALSKFSLILH